MRIVTLMENSTQSGALCAEHGLSLYIETGGRRILFDAGQTGAFADNAEALGVDLSRVDFAVLSHGHYDHGGGLLRFFEINDHAPVYVHPEAFGAFYSGPEKYIGLAPELKDSGRLIRTGENVVLDQNMFLCDCRDRCGKYPVSGQGLTVQHGEVREPDDFRHEQYLTVIENGRRIVFSGCSHRGVLNIVEWMRPDVLVGGFHFKKLDPDGEGRAALESAAGTLMQGETIYYTGHCTGDAQFDFLKVRMGERLHGLYTGLEIVL